MDNKIGFKRVWYYILVGIIGILDEIGFKKYLMDGYSDPL